MECERAAQFARRSFFVGFSALAEQHAIIIQFGRLHAPSSTPEHLEKTQNHALCGVLLLETFLLHNSIIIIYKS
jgi:hypothetical protein